MSLDITVTDEEGVHYGHSDIAEAVNWLLNEDTEAADVMASGRKFHCMY